MYIRQLFIFCLLLAGAHHATAQAPPPKRIGITEYIAMYKDIAITEMERTGVPASIKLAQAVHESGAGNSELARQANNHFGVKCGSGWTGKTFYRWDDEAQESCFRCYESAQESFVAHSEFLKRKHYAFLFEYDRTDYKSWAYGLKKAGYATDPEYPNKLISTIEKYNLSLYDLERSIVLVPNKDSTITTKPPVTITVVDQRRSLRTKPRSFLFREYRKGFFQQNGTTYAVAIKGESALAMAARFGIPYQKFLKFNDMLDGDVLMEYQYGYIQPKKTTYKGEEAFHRVTKDETMYEISQLYGIKLSDLLLLNLMNEGQEPANGEIILLKEKAAFVPLLRPAGYQDMLPAATDSTALFSKDNKKDDSLLVLRPQPEELKLNSPTYDSVIYKTDTLLNTSEFKDIPPNLYINIDNPDWQDKLPVDQDTTVRDGSLFPPLNNNSDNKNNTPNIVNPFEGTSGTTSISSTRPDTVLTPPTPEPTPLPAEPQWLTHTVQSGETLYRLSLKYKVKSEEIKAWNNLKSDSIVAGQKLKIQKRE